MAEPIEAYLKKLAKKIVRNQRALDFWATGRTAKTLKIEEDRRFKRPDAVFKLKTDTRGGFTYGAMQRPGRKPGKAPPRGRLVRWIRKKPVALGEGQSVEQLAFLIQRSLKEQGNKVYQKKRDPLDIPKLAEEDLDELVSEIADETAEIVADGVDRILPKVI